MQYFPVITLANAIANDGCGTKVDMNMSVLYLHIKYISKLSGTATQHNGKRGDYLLCLSMIANQTHVSTSTFMIPASSQCQRATVTYWLHTVEWVTFCLQVMVLCIQSRFKSKVQLAGCGRAIKIEIIFILYFCLNGKSNK